ncbi:MAG: hypothetical protein ACPGJV_14160 [Bacteriovoracaceae bacterium]
MKNLLIITLFIISSNGFTSSKKHDFSKDELFIELQNVTSIIRSSKTKYKDHYLLIGKVQRLSVAEKEKAKDLKNLKNLMKKDQNVELLLPKSACYEEALTALGMKGQKINFQMNNLKLDFFKETPKSPNYKAFIKASFLQKGDRTEAGCVLKAL